MTAAKALKKIKSGCDLLSGLDFKDANIMWIVHYFKKNFTNICLLRKFWKIQKKYKEVEKKHPSGQQRLPLFTF